MFKILSPVYVITAKLGQKGSEFVNYALTVIERSKSITIQYLRREIHFSGQFLNITKSWDASPYLTFSL